MGGLSFSVEIKLLITAVLISSSIVSVRLVILKSAVGLSLYDFSSTVLRFILT